MPLTSAGYTIPTLVEIKEAIEAEQRSEISANLDLSPSSPDGQNNTIFSRALRVLYEDTQALYAASDPTKATGRSLDALCALTGTTRRAATPSLVVATLEMDPGTYAVGDLVANPVGRPDARFTNAEEIVATGLDVVAVFEAEENGPQAVAGDALEITTPVAGWSSIVGNEDAILGTLTETDTALRLRRLSELTAGGSTTVDAIRADILQNVSGVLEVEIIENDTDVTVDGVPPHAFEAVVYGPAAPTTEDDEALADQIFASKPAGIRAFGVYEGIVLDDQGAAHTIGFTRPTEVDATIVATMEVSGLSVDADLVLAIREYLAAKVQAELRVGDDLDWSEVVGWLMAVPNAKRVLAATVDPSGGGGDGQRVVISRREICRVALGDISLTVNVGGS